MLTLGCDSKSVQSGGRNLIRHFLIRCCRDHLVGDCIAAGGFRNVTLIELEILLNVVQESFFALVSHEVLQSFRPGLERFLFVDAIKRFVERLILYHDFIVREEEKVGSS